ncbi:glycosyltransferase family 2 protein [Planctomyces sp. SH-PL14]|uniref:glycosyltransferase family 2 protein n=1 Tax=Planctomyces sp. SH-PL14 TaxID=1632864 RepID=UPI00078DE0E0|nr:glycosyltransferase family A protein [Planctomyces sp. SH-PL14]AMV19699.1 UDP-Glc:alpha-D-GlcNAc-diphosphoundecaprenol beta-1,3-glucosyltransferase WfgD [Planctomyces sp. SH-PL14]
MPNTIPISVVIPAYNSQDCLRASIQSVQEQTYPVREIIVVDDGSKDATASVAFECGAKVIRQPNGGPAAARNNGIRHAKSPWIALLDADDSWLPNKLERQVLGITDDVSFLHTYCVIDETGPTTEDVVTFETLWKRNTLGTSTILMRKSAWEDVGGFEEDRGIMGVEDYNLWLRLVHKGHKVHTIRERLVHYTPADGNLSGQLERMMRSELNNVEKIDKACGLTPDQKRRKLVQIYEEWGRAMFHARDMKKARRCYGEILSIQPRVHALVRWMATYMPVSLLNLRRTAVHA